MFESNPVVAWISVVITVLTLGASTAGGWFFILETRASAEDQHRLLMEIRAEQVQIRRELAEQTVDLESIKNTQGGFVELREGQRWLASMVRGNED